MSKVLIIGVGGVGTVVAHKVAQNRDVFSEIVIASRTKSKCDALASELNKKYGVTVQTDAVDADYVEQVVALFRKHNPELVINVALPYQDLTIMDVWSVVLTIWIQQIMNQKMKLILNIVGSGLIKIDLKKPD